MKRCPKCGVLKPVTDFHKNRAARDGLQVRCKPCHIAGVSAAIRNNPKRHLVQTNKYRATHRERVKETERLRYQRSFERVRLRDERLTTEELAALKPVRQAERFRIWRERHPERYLEQGRRRTMKHYAQKKAAQGSATTDQIRQRWLYYGNRCWMCRAPATQTDHVIPLNRGGTDWPSNQRPACGPCNKSKSDKLPFELVA